MIERETRSLSYESYQNFKNKKKYDDRSRNFQNLGQIITYNRLKAKFFTLK